MKTRTLLKSLVLFALASVVCLGVSSAQNNLLLYQQVTLANMGDYWSVTECCGWSGTWVRRGTSNTFDAKWRHTNGTEVTDVLELVSFNSKNGEVIIRRASLNGQYKATYQPRAKTLVNGTATWYPKGATWSARIDEMGQDEKGPVHGIRR